MNEIPMTEIPKSPMVIGSAIPLTPMTLAPSVGESALLAHIKRLEAKVERLEEAIEDLIEQNLGIQPWSN